MANGLHFDILDPAAVVNSTDPMLRYRLTSGGPLYGAMVSISPRREMADSLEADELASCRSDAGNRKNSESVVTLPL
jgi:hypothetical protein